MQSKRIQVNETNDGVGAATNVVLDVPTDPRESANFHNIWVGVSVEPQDAAANAQGTWILLYLTDPTVAVPAGTDAAVNLETANYQIIACGVWSASNETPFNLPPTQIKTSRTLPAGGRLVLTNTVTGITAGLASNRVMLCAHVVRS